MHQYLIELASLMAIFSFAIISPGADLAMVMRQAMVHGRKQAIITSFGVGTSLMFHVTYTILGLGLIISQSIYLFNIVKWLGVAYLIYIGVKALRAGKTELPMRSIPSRCFSSCRSFRQWFMLTRRSPSNSDTVSSWQAALSCGSSVSACS
jgi:threonine/homoserine/homoserine lactone efflux protein